ncbi:Protein MRG2 [Gryllus bimaculatus]|nr:Protein MRG2 [Gryllus bimaculatus]
MDLVKKIEAFQEGDTVLVSYQNSWYPARILKVRSLHKDGFRVHYLGYKKRWDEWVQSSMIIKYTEQNFEKYKAQGKFKPMYVKRFVSQMPEKKLQKQETPSYSQSDTVKLKEISPKIGDVFQDEIMQDSESKIEPHEQETPASPHIDNTKVQQDSPKTGETYQEGMKQDSDSKTEMQEQETPVRNTGETCEEGIKEEPV